MGRNIDCNIACKKINAPEEIKLMKRKKVFVGGLTAETNNSKKKIFKIFF